MHDEVKAAIAELGERVAEAGALRDQTEERFMILEERIGEMECRGQGPSFGGVWPGTEAAERKSFAAYLLAPHSPDAQAELRALEGKAATGTLGSSGGFAVPDTLAGAIMMRARDLSPIRDVATVYQVGAGSPKLLLADSNAGSGWAAEGGARNATATPTLTKVEPPMGTAFCSLVATEELMSDAEFDVTEWFTESAAQALAAAEGHAFVAGDGIAKPSGLLRLPPEAGADRTEGALRYVPSGAAAGFDAANPGDALLDLVYGLRAEYRARGVWVMNSAAAAEVRKIKDGQDRHLWADSLAEGQPARLLGYPVTIAEDMPDLEAGAFPIVFGDRRRAYVIVEKGEIRVTLDDNITTPGQVKWYIRRRVGGAVYDSNAAVALKIAES